MIEWLHLVGYGERNRSEPRGQTRSEFREVLQPGHAQRVAAALDARRASEGARFRGVPIYRGKPGADGWRDERRLGSVIAIEARGDGIHVRVLWNDEGEQNRREGYYLHPEPHWLYDPQRKRAGRGEPLELIAIGMTNKPDATDAFVWTNSAATQSPNMNQTTLSSGHDVSTAMSRRHAFNARIDELTAAGMAYNAAIAKMKETPEDAALLKAMGAFTQGEWSKLDPRACTPHGGTLPHLWRPEERSKRFHEIMDPSRRRGAREATD